MDHHRGFSLIELVSVVVIVGVLAATVGPRFTGSALLQLQAGRDQLIAALLVAQQKAMAQSAPVQLITSGATIDIRVDSNRDNVFSVSESILFAGTRYPLSVSGGISFSDATLSYDRRGYVTPTSITLTQKSQTVAVTITGTGYAY